MMRILDIIEKKKRRLELSNEEIDFFIGGLNDLPDYQISALLMAIRLNGLTPAETARLTIAMRDSGETLDLGELGEYATADKHSTGGVGDKTTLAVAPIVAACGVYMPKMSGRGLGHTGGTIDKIESIPGAQTSISRKDFFDITRKAGFCVAGQSANLAPADKKLYALRDVTATVDSIPLIAASVMSKKLAAGAQNILLDVKAGSGAFMKTYDDARELAALCVDIGKRAGKNAAAVITDMSAPLGKAVGNALEVIEAAGVLRGNAPEDISNLCRVLAEEILVLAGGYNTREAKEAVAKAIESGAALDRLALFIELIGGDPSYIYDTTKFKTAAITENAPSPAKGYIASIDAELIGAAARLLGAGRLKTGDDIDHAAGIIINKKPGDYAEQGEPLAALHTNSGAALYEAKEILIGAYGFSTNKVNRPPLVMGKVS